MAAADSDIINGITRRKISYAACTRSAMAAAQAAENQSINSVASASALASFAGVAIARGMAASRHQRGIIIGSGGAQHQAGASAASKQRVLARVIVENSVSRSAISHKRRGAKNIMAATAAVIKHQIICGDNAKRRRRSS